MREHYEKDGHKIMRRNGPASFSEFLEYYSYLGPEELNDKRKRIIKHLKGEEDGAGLEDTSR